MLFLANDKVFSTNNTDTFPARGAPRGPDFHPCHKNNCNLVVYFMPATGKSSAKTALHDFPGFVRSYKMYSVKFCHLFFSAHKSQHTHGPLVLANSVISGPRISVVFVNSACTLCAQVCECPKTVSYITTLSYMPGFTPGEVLLLSPSLPLLQLGSAINFATFSCWPSSSCSSSGRCCVLVRLQLDTTHNQYNPHLLVVPARLG